MSVVGVKIAELPQLLTPQADDKIPVQHGQSTYKINYSDLKGEKGDTGDVTPEVQQALADAQAAAQAANASAEDAEAAAAEVEQMLDGAVRYDEAQTLTDAQKQQARDNIGAGTGGGGTGAVRYDEAQTLTDAQKTTARGNIAAASADDVGALSAAMTYVVSGNKSIETASIPVGAYVRLVGSTIAGRSDGIYTVATAIPVDTVIDGPYFNESAPIQGGGLNALNATLGSYELLYSGGNTDSAIVPSLSKYKWLLLVATWDHVIGVSTLIPRGVCETKIQSWYVNHIDGNGYRLARLTYINDTTIKITGITASGWVCELYGIK